MEGKSNPFVVKMHQTQKQMILFRKLSPHEEKFDSKVFGSGDFGSNGAFL